ncbi:MAG: ABC transporter permease subunit [Wenzhouxiangellaceae bacterium]|nr:ABC transporter permease subunit [Wenzhouxiangellaceae bacterium]
MKAAEPQPKEAVPDAFEQALDTRGVRGRSLYVDALLRLRRNRAALAGAATLLVIVLLVTFGPMLNPWDHEIPDWDHYSTPPSLETGHVLGTDALGRDMFERVMIGGRISLLVGLIATLVSLVIGVTYGAIAGHLGGRIDNWMMRAVDAIYALPFMFFVILLMVVFGRNIFLIFVAIGAVNWLDMARIVRGQTLSLKNKDFIEAARASGATEMQVIIHHIVPNLLGVVAVYVSLTIPQVILVESFLSFLGLGVQEPLTSWGALVNEGAQELETAPWSLLFPAAFLAATLFAFNFLGDGLRDALDPKDR